MPKNVEDSVIKASSLFRAGGRFPVLSYYHKPSKVSFFIRTILKKSSPYFIDFFSFMWANLSEIKEILILN